MTRPCRRRCSSFGNSSRMAWTAALELFGDRALHGRAQERLFPGGDGPILHEVRVGHSGADDGGPTGHPAAALVGLDGGGPGARSDRSLEPPGGNRDERLRPPLDHPGGSEKAPALNALTKKPR